MKSHALTSLGVFTTAALAASRTSAPDGCVTVPDDFSSIQAAVDSSPDCIFIQPGTYSEQVLVPSGAGQLSIYGYTEDDTSYEGNTVHVVQSKAASQGYSNDETATLRVKTDGFKLYNVDIENSFGEGSQAVALSAYSDSGFYGSRFIGYQDTVLANEGYQIYIDSEITGATDYIFGHSAIAWFERVDLRCVDRSIGYVTGMPPLLLY
jgi:pectinesterase